MKRTLNNTFRGVVLVLLTIAIMPDGAHAQGDFSDVQINATHVSGAVYMLSGAGGNIGVSIGDDGVLMIDDQFAPLSEKISTVIDSLGGKKLRFLLNTHWHGDHVGGNEVFGKTPTIIAHTNVRKRISVDQDLPRGKQAAKPENAWPVITFDDSLSAHFNGEEIKAIHLPGGHTDGDIFIHFSKSNVFHVGDLFFNGMFPFVDLSTGGNAIQYAENVRKLLELIPPNARIIPGHGALGTYEELEVFSKMLDETIAYVRKAKNAGKTLEQLQGEGLPDAFSGYSWSFVPTSRWIETVFKSLN